MTWICEITLSSKIIIFTDIEMKKEGWNKVGITSSLLDWHINKLGNWSKLVSKGRLKHDMHNTIVDYFSSPEALHSWIGLRWELSHIFFIHLVNFVEIYLYDLWGTPWKKITVSSYCITFFWKKEVYTIDWYLGRTIPLESQLGVTAIYRDHSLCISIIK